MINLDVGYISDIGNTRKVNQDRVGVFVKSNAALFVVADGMGGMDCGEVASTMVIDCMSKWIDSVSFDNISLTSLEDKVYELFCEVNTNVYEYCIKNNVKTGTTATALLIVDEYAVMAYSGDSRLYYVKGGKACQFTEDENLYNYIVKNGLNIENPQHNKSVLTSYIGRADDISVTLKKFAVCDEDIILLCSDGFYNYYNFESFYNISSAYKMKAQQYADRCAEIVKKTAAADNLSLIVVKCGTGDFTGDM